MVQEDAPLLMGLGGFGRRGGHSLRRQRNVNAAAGTYAYGGKRNVDASTGPYTHSGER